MPDKPSVAVIGNIGAGKSTLLQQLRETTVPGQWMFVDEPVQEWRDNGLLAAFYANPAHMGVAFQFVAFTSRLKLLAQQAQQRGSRGIISDNHIVVDRYVFADANLGKDEQVMNAYCYMWDTWKLMAPESRLDLVIYLRQSPTACLRRVEQRGRAEETGVDLAYLESLHARFEDLAVHPDRFGDRCDFHMIEVEGMSQGKVCALARTLCNSWTGQQHATI